MQVWGFGCYQVAYLGQKGAMELPEKTKKKMMGSGAIIAVR